jgi:replicative superfamily II helicase
MSELAMLRVFKNTPFNKIIFIAPLKALEKEIIIDWKKRLENGPLKKSVLELTGDITPDLKALQKADVLIVTPEKWDGISRNW